MSAQTDRSASTDALAVTPDAEQLHRDAIVIDGLIVAKWGTALFEDMQRGGLTAANCTVSIWEGFQDTVDAIVEMNRLIDAHPERLLKVRSTADILRAKREGRTGVILGFQNAMAFEDQIGYVQVFKDLGVGVVQLCYNTQNLVGTGCYERDGGLSGFGHEILAEMNRVGILCDLSHVGPNTAREAILASTRPVCYSHCLPSGLKDHPRNKSDDELKFIADHGGFVGVTMFAPFLKNGPHSTIDDYVEAIRYVFNLVGEEQIGIGTDFTQGHDQVFFSTPGARQGLRPSLDELRRDRQSAWNTHRGRIPEPHRSPAERGIQSRPGATHHG